MSTNLLLPNETDPVIWRGPVISGVVQQFWTDVLWNCDYLFVDMPPGTGDVSLSVFQSIPLDGIVIVASPQELVSMVVEKAVKMGKVRAIGISNFDANDEVFNEIMEKSTIKPAVLQIECHPYAQRVEMRKKAAKYGIQVECWYPLGGAQSQGLLLRDPVIKKIAEAHGKSPAQIILRWHIQEGFSVIPGATNPDYIKENIQIFDFALTDNEMQQIRSLNKEQRIFNASMEDVKRMIWGTKL